MDVECTAVDGTGLGILSDSNEDRANWRSIVPRAIDVGAGGGGQGDRSPTFRTGGLSPLSAVI